MRKVFFGLIEPTREPTLRAGQRAGLILFAYGTWLYRLTVFLGIALLVYHIAFKLLGIFLMLVELVWFIARPVWTEAAYLWRSRQSGQAAWRPLSLVGAIFPPFLWLGPISFEGRAPPALPPRQ